MTHAWHAVLGLAGSLVAVHSPRVGAALLLVAAVSVLADALFGVSLGRRLTPERASQNVIALPPKGTRRRRVSLILTANYDAPRAGYVDRDALRRPVARIAHHVGLDTGLARLVRAGADRTAGRRDRDAMKAPTVR